MISSLLLAEWKQSSEKESERAGEWAHGQRTATRFEFYKKQLMEYKDSIQKYIKSMKVKRQIIMNFKIK